MINALNELLAPAAMERLTLVINHVLRADAEATRRLALQQGRSVATVFDGWPTWLPPPPALAFRLTPAGLLEWCGLAGVDLPDLRVRVDVSRPARLASQILSSETPDVLIEGDAALAAEVGWVLDHVRWDVAADLERLFGPAAAQALHGAGRWLARGLSAGVKGVGDLADRFRPGAR
jgi:ubiquinone biosynthesis accessory factor UbiJ